MSVISTMPISGRPPTGAKRRWAPRSTLPERSISLMRPFKATRSAGPTLKARTMSRLPTGVGLAAMKARMSSRLGSPAARRAPAALAGRGAASRLLGRFRLVFGGSLLPGARLGTRRSFRLPSALRGLSLGLLRRQELDGALERHGLGRHVARQRRV